jgi:hypothetical protein
VNWKAIQLLHVELLLKGDSSLSNWHWSVGDFPEELSQLYTLGKGDFIAA